MEIRSPKVIGILRTLGGSCETFYTFVVMPLDFRYSTVRPLNAATAAFMAPIFSAKRQFHY